MTKSTTSPSSASHETSSLLGGSPPEKRDSDNQHHHQHRGSATVLQTILNESNTCMGTGCLALPFAARLGGVVLHVAGIVGIAMWNVYSVGRLCQCLYLLPKEAVLYEDEDDSSDSDDTETIAVSALEKNKSQSFDSANPEEGNALELAPPHHTHIDADPCHHRPTSNDMLPRYDATTISSASSQTTHPVVAAHATAIKVYPPPPPGTSTYSRVAWYAFGPAGLLALDVLMIILFIGVVVTFVNAIRGFLRDTPLTTGSDLLDAIGIAFVIGPMSTVKDMGYLSKASATGIVALCFSFGVIGLYGLFLGYHDGTEVVRSDDSIISLNWFPENGMDGVSTWFGATVFGYGVAPLTYNFRESMRQPEHMVPASTVALLIVAIAYIFIGVGVYSLFRNVDGDILHVLPSEGWLPMLTRLSMAVVVSVTAPLLIVPCGQLVEGKILRSSAVSHDVPYSIRAMVRIGIALMCVSVSVFVPGFVSVLSLVGCASVATVGFVVPPALFLRLRLMRAQWSWDLTFDAVMLLWGIVATGITTSYTFEDVMSSKV